MKKKLLCLFLIAALGLSMTACTKIQAESLNLPRKPREMENHLSDSGWITDFGRNLLKKTADQNSLISPLSILYALGMTANGAEGTTLSEMESVLGQPLSRLNDDLGSYLSTLSEDSTVSLSNSLWFRDGFSENPAFVQDCMDYYHADLFRFQPKSVVSDVNHWVKDHTSGRIPKILTEEQNHCTLYLVNALCFDGKWEQPYEKDQVLDREFHGATETVTREFLLSEEALYLQDENATGFLKPYEGGRFWFGALLPQEGMDPREYLDTASGLWETVQNPSMETVRVELPKCKVQSNLPLKDILSQLGMAQAFTPAADFSRMQTEKTDLYLDFVQHMCVLELDEQGTRAAAATVVGAAECAPESILKTVVLDRPFLYFLWDRDYEIPLFLGICDLP